MSENKCNVSDLVCKIETRNINDCRDRFSIKVGDVIRVNNTRSLYIDQPNEDMTIYFCGRSECHGDWKID